LGSHICLQIILGLFAGAPFHGQGIFVRQLSVGQPGLQCLNVAQCLVQRTPRCAMGSTFSVQGGIQLRNTRFEWSCGIVVAPVVQHDNRHAAILHKTVTWPSLIGALLRCLTGRAL